MPSITLQKSYQHACLTGRLRCPRCRVLFLHFQHGGGWLALTGLQILIVREEVLHSAAAIHYVHLLHMPVSVGQACLLHGEAQGLERPHHRRSRLADGERVAAVALKLVALVLELDHAGGAAVALEIQRNRTARACASHEARFVMQPNLIHSFEQRIKAGLLYLTGGIT